MHFFLKTIVKKYVWHSLCDSVQVDVTYVALNNILQFRL
jgi:hypothetical protein